MGEPLTHIIVRLFKITFICFRSINFHSYGKFPLGTILQGNYPLTLTCEVSTAFFISLYHRSILVFSFSSLKVSHPSIQFRAPKTAKSARFGCVPPAKRPDFFTSWSQMFVSSYNDCLTSCFKLCLQKWSKSKGSEL